VGIKRLAPELGVDYTYLSKLENEGVRPSEQLVRRVAHYFDEDEDILLLSAARLPADVLRALQEHPDEALRLIRERFQGEREAQQPSPLP
jgi:transcriptional regulator with XRE-family HTH domain